ncbi:hypothetical protein GCM10022225_59260 [Plantactinospora mayteni]|uniref:Uncharacterized protein n=1 Tax=Plantactinospora mayteni TaxID=566021 RepID=A0ABQ4EKH5_9ACTN|nr:hypothetical protein [Plantactinospora mayteni]GIG95223.1 hypothetical protein Pma05_17960 [Plantactinospora mayteni]
MIVDAGIYLFDHRLYRERVVSAVRRLHATGQVEPWLEAAWQSRHHPPTPVPRFTSHLREVTADLIASPDLAGTTPSGLIAPPTRPRRRRPAARTGGPGDGPGDPEAVEQEAVEHEREWQELRHLFRLAVETTCLGAGVFVGNAVDAPELAFCLDEPVMFHPDVRACLEWLAERGRAWSLGDEDAVIGVRGWLDPVETWFLADELDQVALPPIDASFAAIRAARASGIGTCADGQSHPRLRATVRAVAAIAVERGQGVLWGWDLTPPGDD